MTLHFSAEMKIESKNDNIISFIPKLKKNKI